ncbi:MAG: 50S ribosomal protein L31 [Patescibacteria group bacterium]
MKTDIHPAYFTEAKATCSCGATFLVGSTKEKIQVEICSQCHPFYTGNDKVIDTAGRLERFKARAALAKPLSPKGKALAKKKNK